MSDELTHLFIEFYDKLASWEHSIVRDSEISLAQMHAIEVIGYYGKAKMKNISGKLGITMGTLTVMINTLEKKGLVTKEKNKKDSRSFQISLTAKGNNLYTIHHKHHHELISDLLGDVDSAKMETFKEVLNVLLTNF